MKKSTVTLSAALLIGLFCSIGYAHPLPVEHAHGESLGQLILLSSIAVGLSVGAMLTFKRKNKNSL